MLYNPANGNRLRVFSWDRFDKNVYVLVLEDMLNGFPYRYIFNSCHFQGLNSRCILNKTKVILLLQFDVFLRPVYCFWNLLMHRLRNDHPPPDDALKLSGSSSHISAISALWDSNLSGWNQTLLVIPSVLTASAVSSSFRNRQSRKRKGNPIFCNHTK